MQLSQTSSSFYTDETIKSAHDDLYKCVKKIKHSIAYLNKVIAMKKLEIINDNIVILIEDILNLERKIGLLVPQLLTNCGDDYSMVKLMRLELCVRLAGLIKFGDKLLVRCTDYEHERATKENLIYDYLVAAIEDYVEEIKKCPDLPSTQVDCVDGDTLKSSSSSVATATHHSHSNLSWCDDEHDLKLLRRRGFVRVSSTSSRDRSSNESGFSSQGSYDLENDVFTESITQSKSETELDIVSLQPTWEQFVRSRTQFSAGTNTSTASSQISFRPSIVLPSKCGSVVFGSNYTVELKNRLTIDNQEVVLRKASSREDFLHLEDTVKLPPDLDVAHHSIPIQPADADRFIEYETVEQYLWIKNGLDGRIVHGGTVDALIVFACNNKQKDYSDAFITTYKSFIGTRDLISKLIYRFEYFMKKDNPIAYKIAKKTFALLLIIVNELSQIDLDINLFDLLIDCTFRINALGELKLGHALRRFVVDKIFEFNEWPKKGPGNKNPPPVSTALRLTSQTALHPTNFSSILDIKPEILAQQICLQANELLKAIKSSELLVYIDKQDLEIAPNFAAVAKYYNRISFWAATAILKEDDHSIRSKLIFYFVRVMRKLLEYHNFDSCCALNSTFCSVAIYRIIPDIKALDEFIDIFDNGHNYRVYRERLNRVKGPCMPIMFIVIRDLIHMHNAMKDEVGGGLVHFAKLYQMYNRLDMFRHAKTHPYNFRNNSAVLSFVNNFQDIWDEPQLIEKSYKIKPLGKHEDYGDDCDDFFRSLIRCYE